jgi:hypothetical protein
MRPKFAHHSARWLFAAVCLAAMSSGGNAGSFTRGCAAKDLQALMLIERHESTNMVAREKLSDALFAMMSARLVCHEGRVRDALAMYDEIVQGITPNAFLVDHLH